MVHGDHRKARVSRFPYVVFYRMIDGDVVAVVHNRRGPAYLRDRLN